MSDATIWSITYSQLMALAKARAVANKTFIVQASLTIVTDDCQNIFASLDFSSNRVVTDKKSN